MAIKAVIFDQDGVILESESIQSKAYALVLEEYGKKPVLCENGLVQPFVGARGEVVWEELKKRYNLAEDTNVLREKRRQAILKLLDGEIEPNPGVIKLLEYLKREGFRIALATGTDPRIVDKILTRFEIKGYFEVVVTGGDTQKSKPDPEAYIIASRRLGIAPSDCLVIEDAEVGVAAAKSAGMRVIAVNTKYNSTENLKHANLVVNSLQDQRVIRMLSQQRRVKS